MSRILRNLKINEVSGVDRGAGRGVKIMLMKRDDGIEITRRAPTEQDLQEVQMRNDVLKGQAFALWQEQINDIRKRDNCSRSAAIDRLQQTDIGSRLWSIVKNLTGDVAKLGGGGSEPHEPELGGRVKSPTWDSGHGASSNSPDPHRSVRTDVDADAVEKYRAYQDAVKTNMRAGMKRGAALDQARREMSEEDWASIKNLSVSDVHVPGSLNDAGSLDGSAGRSKTMLPLSHDGNALRGSTPAAVDRANRSMAQRGGRPYGLS
jgi:hypothetical protein